MNIPNPGAPGQVTDVRMTLDHDAPTLLLQCQILVTGSQVSDGIIVESTALVWRAIFLEIQRDPQFLIHFSRNSRAFENFIAGAYIKAGFDEVIITPQRGDRGRDVIATKHGFLSVRILDQTKAYKPGHLVTHDDVRAMVGVLNIDQNASKGLITTTSDFQPGIASSPEFQRFMPHRLELKNGAQLKAWLTEVAHVSGTDKYGNGAGQEIGGI